MSSSYRSSSIRPGSLALIRIGIKETLSRRRLIAYLVRADLKKSGADTLLGNVWWVLDPLLQMLVYYVLVGVILKRNTYEDYPLFIFAAILPWKWFDATVKDGVSSVVSQERLIKQIYFPKLVLPVASTFSGVVGFAFGLIPLLGMLALFYPNHLSAWVLLIPVIAVVQFLFSLGVAVGVAAINVFYRDVGNLSRHLLRFWFFLSPTLYGLDKVEDIVGSNEIVKVWYAINPFSYLLTAYRDVIYYGRPPEWLGLVVVGLLSLVLIALAILGFKRVEPTFAKVL